MYRSGHNLTQALEAMRAFAKSAEAKHLIEFLETPTERGIVK